MLMRGNPGRVCVYVPGDYSCVPADAAAEAVAGSGPRAAQCEGGGAARDTPEAVAQRFPAADGEAACDIVTLEERFTKLWLARNKPSRMADVTAEFQRIGAGIGSLRGDAEPVPFHKPPPHGTTQTLTTIKFPCAVKRRCVSAGVTPPGKQARSSRKESERPVEVTTLTTAPLFDSTECKVHQHARSSSNQTQPPSPCGSFHPAWVATG